MTTAAAVEPITARVLLFGDTDLVQAVEASGVADTVRQELEELVELLSHRVTIDHQPSIDLLVNGKLVTTVRFRLLLQVTVEALTATVRRGRLIGLRAGRCDVEASARIAGNTVATRHARLTLPFSMRLGSGIQLVE